jgi:hypothetical protein
MDSVEPDESSVNTGRRGFLALLTGMFWSAATALLGSSSGSCATDDDPLPDDADALEGRPPDVRDQATVDARHGCYADSDADDGWYPPPDAADDDGAADAADADAFAPEDALPETAPDAEPDKDDPPDTGVPEEWLGLRPEERRRRLKWADRTVERTREARRLLADPLTDPTVRNVLRAQAPTLSRWNALAKRWRRLAGTGGPATG